MSTVSSTDVDIFRRLSNPEVVDINVSGNNSTRLMAAHMRKAIARATTEAAAQEVQDENEEEEDEEPQSGTGGGSSSSAAAAAPSRLSQAMSSMATQRSTPVEQPPEPMPRIPEVPRPPTRPETSAPTIPMPRVAPSMPARPEPSVISEEASDGEAEPGPRDPETQRLEKQGLLIDLQALQRKGVTLSRQFSMKDSIESIELELQKQQNNLSTAAAVTFMRDALRMAFTGIEIANAKMGPILSIDGWAESLSSDMKRFDGALERLYRRYWRKTTMSPIMELAWIILGSLVTCHFKNKFFGPMPKPAAQAAPMPEPPRAPPVARSKATQRFSSGTPSVPKATGSLRPTLRPPSSMFGFA